MFLVGFDFGVCSALAFAGVSGVAGAVFAEFDLCEVAGCDSALVVAVIALDEYGSFVFVLGDFCGGESFDWVAFGGVCEGVGDEVLVSFQECLFFFLDLFWGEQFSGPSLGFGGLAFGSCFGPGVWLGGGFCFGGVHFVSLFVKCRLGRTHAVAGELNLRTGLDDQTPPGLPSTPHEVNYSS